MSFVIIVASPSSALVDGGVVGNVASGVETVVDSIDRVKVKKRGKIFYDKVIFSCSNKKCQG